MNEGTKKARVVFLIRVPNELQGEFLESYQRIRFLVSEGVSGHLRDEVCQSKDDPEQWLITSEWESIESFLTWESTEEHSELVAPMRECMTEAKSLRFIVEAETGRTVQ